MMGPIWPRFMLKTGEDEGADEDGVVSLSSCWRGGDHVQVRHWLTTPPLMDAAMR